MSKAKKAAAILIPTAAIIAAIIIIIAATASPGPFAGNVTFNGQGLENVSVSDGRNVVKTDKDGNFKLKGYRKKPLTA